VDPLDLAVVESDPKYPSGPWTGFYLQWWLPGRHTMTIDLAFDQGQMRADGSDIVGTFTFQGDYDRADGNCNWVKTYLGRHRVTYKGVNEGQGIWGVWEIRQLGGLYKDQGVFHIWPLGMTPDASAEATVQTYLAQVRSRWLMRFLSLVLGFGLIFAMLFFLRHVFHFSTRDGIFP
jgi:hypothetical protein